MKPVQTREPVPPPGASPRQWETTLLLIDAPGRDALDRHPDVRSRRNTGWSIRRVAPRVVEDDGAKLLVVLERPTRSTHPPFTPDDGPCPRQASSRDTQSVR